LESVALYALGLLGNYRETNVMGMDAFLQVGKETFSTTFQQHIFFRNNSPPFAKFEDAFPFSREVLFILESQNWILVWC